MVANIPTNKIIINDINTMNIKESVGMIVIFLISHRQSLI